MAHLRPAQIMLYRYLVSCLILANSVIKRINFDLFQEMANKKATVGAMVTALKEAGMSSIAEEVFKVNV